MRKGDAVLAIALLMAAAVPAFAAGDPFSGIVNAINSNARQWAGAMMVVGLLGAGGAISMGSHNSGTWARNVLFGSLFLLLAGAGVAAFSKIESLLGGAL